MLTARQRELKARHLLAHLDQISKRLKERNWEDVLAVAEFAALDAPLDLAQTDPALYRLLRAQITEYNIRGWHLLNVAKLKQLIQTCH